MLNMLYHVAPDSLPPRKLERNTQQITDPRDS